MKMSKTFNFLILLLLIGSSCFFSFLNGYEVQFRGIEDEKILKLIHSLSQLEKLKNKPPSSPLGLKKRAEEEIIKIQEILNSEAFYEGKARFSIEKGGELVIITIDSGPLYPLAGFKVIYLQNDKPFSSPDFCPPTLEAIGIELGKSALPETILNGEDALLDKLNLQGYPFATIKKRDVAVDQKEKKVFVTIEAELKNLAYFGPITLKGLERTCKSFFCKKIKWHEGELYNPLKIEKTQEALELSGLFRSVTITQGEYLLQNTYLPIEINVLEAKQRSIGFGINYATEFESGITGGFGLDFEWEDRNVKGEGNKLNFQGDLWQRLQNIKLSYSIPDFKISNQNLILATNYEYKRIKAYTEYTYTLSSTLERILLKNFRISYGTAYQWIRVKRSDPNGTFNLFKFPFQLRWSTAKDLLNPTNGISVHLKSVPTLQISTYSFPYLLTTITTSYYIPLQKKPQVILAAKLMLGSIIGGSKHEIAPPEKFRAGSENALRGYRYDTVSPLNKKRKPIGGRSLFIYSLEARTRVSETLGWVLFYELGNVYAAYYPEFQKRRFLQSFGLGLRYFTVIGPLRADIAFPLNRRHKIDKRMTLYFSIGQAF